MRNKLFTALRQELPENVAMSTTDNAVPASFPHVALVQKNSYIYRGGIDSERIGNMTRVMYEISIFTDDLHGRSDKAWALAEIVDNFMERNGFVRSYGDGHTDSARGGVFRVFLRYLAVIDNRDGTVYVT